jgi:hypothetical protein
MFLLVSVVAATVTLASILKFFKILNGPGKKKSPQPTVHHNLQKLKFACTHLIDIYYTFLFMLFFEMAVAVCTW